MTFDGLDGILPTQVVSVTRDSGPRRLAVAVLQLALNDLGTNSTLKPGDRESALDWFTADDWRWPYSFLNVTHALGLDPAGVRRALAGRRAA